MRKERYPLRGHNDSGVIGLEEPLHNDGNFRSILRFRAKTDEQLKTHLVAQKAKSRSTFTCPTIQNEKIKLCRNKIFEQVIIRIKNSGYFAVLADDTQDVSRHEQLSLCVRYVDDTEQPIIREDFITFVHVEDLSAEALSRTIIQNLTDLGLDMNLLVGQGYGGAAVMSGHLKGVRTIITEKYPKAIYVHCFKLVGGD